VTAGTLSASPLFSWGASRARTGRPRRAAVEAPHWRAVLRWSLEWPSSEDPVRTFDRVVGRWFVRVA
jgi:hypothetical protein